MAQEGYSYLFKYVIIGDEEVGKTNLLQQYVHDTFFETYVSTVGVDLGIRTLKLSGENIKLQIWDTAGQERFQSITTIYYRGASAIFIVYDVTSRATFNHVSDWLENVRKYSTEQTAVCLIGNKTDLEEEREVTYDEGREFADDNGLLFLECSARTKENLQKAFLDLTEKVYHQKQDTSTPEDGDGLVVEIWDRADKVSLMTLSSNTHTVPQPESTDPTSSGTHQQPSTSAHARDWDISRNRDNSMDRDNKRDSDRDSDSDGSSSADSTPALTHYSPGFNFAKCVMIGESGAGKTCFLKQFAHKKFVEDTPHTIGVEFETRVVELSGEKIKLQIWDTAGQERFRCITQNYYRGARGIFVVYDITRRDTFSKLNTWITNVKNATDDGTVIFLIGNKSDLEGARCVTYEEGRRFADENGMTFIECSAKTGDNVRDAFVETAKKIYEKMQESGLSYHDSGGVGLDPGSRNDTIHLSAPPATPTQPQYEVGCPC